MYGDDGDDTLYGGPGSGTLEGNAGDDALYGFWRSRCGTDEDTVIDTEGSNVVSAWPDSCDADGDGGDADMDCDDSDATVSPSAEEVCGDVVDNDCGGFTDSDDDDCN